MSNNFRRYFVRLSYLGCNYRGTQKQLSGNILDLDSVQGTIESAFYKFAPKLVKLPTFVFAGRTDAGVHALSIAAHVDLELVDGGPVNGEHMIRMMNRYLMNTGHQIRILQFYQVSENFHARYSAKNREYLYGFLVAKEPDFHQVPIMEIDRSAHIHRDCFDLDKFKSGLELFKGVKDFTTFSAKSFDKIYNDNHYKSYVRTMDCWMEEATPLLPSDPLSNKFNYYHVYFSSKGFLYNQIRRIIGSLFSLAGGKISENDIQIMLQVPNRSLFRCNTARPHGLYLKDVQYDEKDIEEIIER